MPPSPALALQIPSLPVPSWREARRKDLVAQLEGMVEKGLAERAADAAGDGGGLNAALDWVREQGAQPDVSSLGGSPCRKSPGGQSAGIGGRIGGGLQRRKSIGSGIGMGIGAGIGLGLGSAGSVSDSPQGAAAGNVLRWLPTRSLLAR
jgi:hypothetical protein